MKLLPFGLLALVVSSRAIDLKRESLLTGNVMNGGNWRGSVKKEKKKIIQPTFRDNLLPSSGLNSDSRNTGLKVHPEPDDPQSRLIWLNKTTIDLWSEKLDNYVEVYRTASLTQGRVGNLIDCDYESNNHLDDKVCRVDTEKFNPCIVTNYFGYRAFKPCVFIELQKMEGWKPRYYNGTASLPKNMPKSLKSYINDVTQEPYMWETVWISCDGDAPADKEFIGLVQYLPHQGYPGYMFPYTGQKGYLNPTLAINFKGLQSGVVINVICKVWGPGIVQDENNFKGVTKFQLLLD